MTKELEALDYLFNSKMFRYIGDDEHFKEQKDIIYEALQRLEQIDNANPSEALKCLENICKILNEQRIDIKWIFNHEYSTIKQALLKKVSGSQYTNIYIDEFIPTSRALECLEKLKGMEISSMPFSDEYGTQEVDLNDIRKVGSQLNTDFREYTDTIKQTLLKAQEQEKVLDIIKNKKVSIRLLYACKSVEEYNTETCHPYSFAFMLPKLTQEEFDLLKEVLCDD